jgi:hypothetical protein
VRRRAIPARLAPASAESSGELVSAAVMQLGTRLASTTVVGRAAAIACTQQRVVPKRPSPPPRAPQMWARARVMWRRQRRSVTPQITQTCAVRGLRDPHPRNPAATAEIWLYSAVANTPVVPESAREARKLSPAVDPAPIHRLAKDRDLQGLQG